MSSFLHFIIAFTSLPLSLFVRLRSYGFLEHRCDVLKASLPHFAYWNESNLYSGSLHRIWVLIVWNWSFWSTKHMEYWFKLYFVYSEYNDCIHFSNINFFLKKEHYHPLLLLSTEVRTNTDFFHKGCNRTSGSYLLNLIWKYFKSCFELAAGTSSLTHLYLHSSHLYIWHTLRTLHWHNVEMGFNATWRSTERVSSTC